MRRDVFQAIADPNRRAILGLLARQPLTINGIADHFQISRPAVSKHVKILEACGLVQVRQHGRERLCTARLDRLGEVSDWVETYRQMWEERFDRLDQLLVEMQEKEQTDDQQE